jgi:uridine phosphorylase
MGDVQEIGNNREYLTVTGLYKDLRITVASHGVGAGGANVCFQELLRSGNIKVMVRAGTCGALRDEINDGDLIVCTGAVREDAATEQLMPLAYPAIADRCVVDALIEGAKMLGFDHPHEGLSVTQANFYEGTLPPPWKAYVGYDVAAIEMELAALLVLTRMNGALGGGILTSDGNLVRTNEEDMSDYDPHREIVVQSKQKMLQIALEAMVILADEV